MIVDNFQVSQDFGHHGIGKRLFEMAKNEGRKAGAKSLYISACSSKETISLYTAIRCKNTDDVIREIVDVEPFDLQMKYEL